MRKDTGEGESCKPESQNFIIGVMGYARSLKKVKHAIKTMHLVKYMYIILMIYSLTETVTLPTVL